MRGSSLSSRTGFKKSRSTRGIVPPSGEPSATVYGEHPQNCKGIQSSPPRRCNPPITPRKTDANHRLPPENLCPPAPRQERLEASRRANAGAARGILERIPLAADLPAVYP